MTDTSPHTTLLSLHQLVDPALDPLYGPLDLEIATESVVTVTLSDIQALSAPGLDPQSALVTLSDGPAGGPALIVAEPALCSALLARMWRSSRNQGAPLTNVEGEILRQHLTDIVRQWRLSWRNEEISLLPQLALAGPLSMLLGQVPDGPWYVCRTVVLAAGEPVGVLLFCYPALLVPALGRERDKIRWRNRVAGGLSDRDAERARRRFAGALKPLMMPAPVQLDMQLPIGVINTLERGDVIAFDAPIGGALAVRVLDRDLTVRLAQSRGQLSIAVMGVPNANNGDATLATEHHELNDFDHTPAH